MLTIYEFERLKPGDTVWIRIGDKYYKSRVVRKPFYNHDSDEPGWEVETNNGYCDRYSVYLNKPE